MDLQSSAPREPYRIERELQRLERHSLYLARHVGSGTPVLVEVLSTKAHQDADWRAQFVFEAHVACNADPARVVPRKVFEANGRLHALFDVLSGTVVASARLPLEVEDAIDVAIDVALALASIHRQRIVHGALRAEGIVLDRVDGRLGARLVDTGYCVPAGVLRLGQVYSHLAAPPLYAAPELAVGAPLGYASDVYAFGAICFQLLTGVAWDVQLPKRLPRSVPRELAALVVQCLSFKSARRPSSISRVAQTLCRIQSQLSGERVRLQHAVPRAPAAPTSAPGANGFGEHQSWFIEDGAPLTEGQAASLFGYLPEPGAGRVSQPLPAWLCAAMAFLLLPAAGYFVYVMAIAKTW